MWFGQQESGEIKRKADSRKAIIRGIGKKREWG